MFTLLPERLLKWYSFWRLMTASCCCFLEQSCWCFRRTYWFSSTGCCYLICSLLRIAFQIVYSFVSGCFRGSATFDYHLACLCRIRHYLIAIPPYVNLYLYLTLASTCWNWLMNFSVFCWRKASFDPSFNLTYADHVALIANWCLESLPLIPYWLTLLYVALNFQRILHCHSQSPLLTYCFLMDIR